ncbi:MAG: TIGR02147 family protein [Fibrobacteria bacterium]|nr:TIGR02147 family protein [Fibrobacteria bacterium]
MTPRIPKPSSESRAAQVELPAVFGFLDHRDYLREWFEAKRLLVRTFSYRVFARKAGFASHAFLSEVIQGRRNLSDDSIDKCLHALGLVGEAAAYFRALVHYSQETHLDRRRDLLSDLLRLQAAQHVQRVTGSQSEYFTHWLNIAMREVAVFGGFGEDWEGLAGFFRPQVKPEEAREAVALLRRLELIQTDPDGKTEYSCPRLTPGDIDPATLANLKRQMLLLAMDQIGRPSGPDSHVSSVTVSVSRDRLPRIRQILEKARRDILAETGSDDLPADQVLQVNLQMVPLTESLERYRSRHA